MKPQTQNMDVKVQEASTEARRIGFLHGRVRLGRFVVAGAALAGMVAVSMFAGGTDLDRDPLLGLSTQTDTSASGATDLNDPAGPGGAPAPSAPTRVGGGGATSTSIAISQRAFPGGASEVYVARLDNPVDALPASVLPKGPILLAPSIGNVPPEVFNEIRRLNPSRVVVLGGPGAISDDVAQQLNTYTGKPVQRVYGATRVGTAAEIAKFAFVGGNPVVYLANAYGPSGAGSPDAVSAGILSDGPILTVGPNGTDINTAANAVRQLSASRVVALGGNGAISDAILSQVAGGAATDRIAGSTRYQTSQEIAKRVFGSAPSRVYLIPGADLTYGLIAGALSDGPLLMVPGNADGNTRGLVTAFGNPEVTAVGGAEVISDQVMNVAAGYAQAQQQQVQAAAPVAGVHQIYTRYSQQPSPQDAAREEAIHNSINAVRVANGVGALVRDGVMDDAARAWAQQVARTDVFVHSNGALKYADLYSPGWRYAGENMVGFYNIEPAPYGDGCAKAWIGSPGHYANLMDRRFNRTGIGVATGRQWVYAVQNFAQY